MKRTKRALKRKKYLAVQLPLLPTRGHPLAEFDTACISVFSSFELILPSGKNSKMSICRSFLMLVEQQNCFYGMFALKSFFLSRLAELKPASPLFLQTT